MTILIFDYDGVIVDSTHVAITLLNHLHTKYHTPPCTTKRKLKQFYQTNIFTYLMKKGLPKSKLPNILKEIDSFFTTHNKEIRLHKKMKKVLTTLAKHFPLYIISSNHTHVIKQTLRRFELSTIFLEILGADKGLSKINKIKQIKKKHPQQFTIYIGDTQGDIIEGKKAQVHTIGVTWGYHSKTSLLAEQPDKLCTTPKQLLNYLKKIQ